MVLQWATKRLCKFFLKRLNKFLNEEIDVEQLDVQLGSGTGKLTDLVLNTDYINEQVKTLPITLKYGSIARILVRLPSEIEIDGLEIFLSPRETAERTEPRPGDSNTNTPCSSQNTNMDTGTIYMGVNDGVRMIGQMVKSLLLGLRVKVTNVTIGIEGNIDAQDYVSLRIPCIEYGYEDVKGGEDLVKVINFKHASLEVGIDKQECVLGEQGISGCVQVKVPCKGSSKVEVDISVEPVQVGVSLEDVKRILSVYYAYSYSYVGLRDNVQEESVYHDTSSFYESAMRSLTMERGLEGSRCGLPVISDWMRKPELSEPDLAASMDEFFECFDALNQSASSSNFWNWTRSALGATSTSGSAQGFQDTQIEYSFNTTVENICATCVYGNANEALELTCKTVVLGAVISQEASSINIQVNSIEAARLSPSPVQMQYFQRISDSMSSLPRFPVDFKASSVSPRVDILKIMPSSQTPAASVAFKIRSSSRSRVSIHVQPLVAWIDSETVAQLTNSFTQLGALRGGDWFREKPGEGQKQDYKLDIWVRSLRLFLSNTRESSGIILAFDLSGGDHHSIVYEQKQDGGKQSATCTAADGVLYSVSGSSTETVLRIRGDSQGKIRMDMKWTENNKTGSWIAKRAWDGVAVVKNRNTSAAGNNLEFASATALSSESGKSTLDLLNATAALSIQISLPRVRIDVTGCDHFAIFELLAGFGRPGSNRDNGDRTNQTLVSFSARQLEAFINISEKESGSEDPRYNTLCVRVSKLLVISAVALGGEPSATYFHIKHEDGELTDTRKCMELLSFRACDISRGDGGARNALSSGTAGLSVTIVSWPGKQQLADTIITGSLKGGTILTEGGQFDWVPGVVTFFGECGKPFEKIEEAAKDPVRSYFLFDIEDVALRYEPSVESQSKVACAVAAAAFRVSSSDNGSEEYHISLKDVGLHLVETSSRKSASGSLNEQGYVQVAKAPVVGALVKVNHNDSPRWEVESLDNQLYFHTCSDTTAAFGRLVSDLQQLFAPDLSQTAAEFQMGIMKGKLAESFQSSDSDARSSEDVDTDKDGDDGLFDGLVENAFASTKVVKVKKANNGASSSSSTTIRESLHVHRQVNAPRFIEDYYVTEHVSQSSSWSSQESICASSSSVSCTSPRQLSANEPEVKGGWYIDSPVDVYDTHVPSEVPRKKKIKKASNLAYPEAVGRVTLTGWKVKWRLYGGFDWANARINEECVEVSVLGLDLQYDAFSPVGLYASSLVVEIHDIHVYDYSAHAPWKLILGYYHKKSRPRESSSKAVKIHLDAVRPNPLAPLEEYRLSLSLLPLWLHLDQAHLEFFDKFFQSSPNNETDDLSSVASDFNDDTILPFFQVCEMRPLIIRVDYIPRHVDFGALRSGNCFQLINLVPWKGVELQLKSVRTAGVYGWSSLMGVLFGEWLDDISRHQIHKLLRAFGPIRPLCAVGSGAAKLVVFPAEQYKKDKRFLRGMRKGAVAFLQSISLEALGLGANIAAGAHHILVHTEMALGGGLQSDKDLKRRSQPSDTREGLQQAYESISQGLERTAISLLGNPVKVYQRGGGAGVAVASALKASPTAILAPACAAADAVRHALLGVRNGLDPERKRVHDEKHLDDRR